MFCSVKGIETGCFQFVKENLNNCAWRRKSEQIHPELTLEFRRRIQALLDAVNERPLAGDALQQARAIAVLEYLHTQQAAGLLKRLAQGAQGALLTREATAACERLARGTVIAQGGH